MHQIAMSSVLCAVALAAPLTAIGDEAAESSKHRFIQEFINKNFSDNGLSKSDYIIVGDGRAIEAGAFLWSRGYWPHIGTSRCVEPAKWHEEYYRGPEDTEITFTGRSTSISLDAGVNATLDVSGSVALEISERFDRSNEPVKAEVDVIQYPIDRSFGINEFDERCQVVHDFLEDGSMPTHILRVRNTLFLKGSAKATYNFRLAGEGSGSIDGKQIKKIVGENRIFGFLADLIDLNAELSLDGKNNEKSETIYDLTRGTRFATAFRPFVVHEETAKKLLDKGRELQGTNLQLDTINDVQSARNLLLKMGEFNQQSSDYLIAEIFATREPEKQFELVPYDKLFANLDEETGARGEFANYASSIIFANYLVFDYVEEATTE